MMSSCVHAVLAHDFLAAVWHGDLQHMRLIVQLAKYCPNMTSLLSPTSNTDNTQHKGTQVQLKYLTNNAMVTKLPDKTQ